MITINPKDFASSTIEDIALMTKQPEVLEELAKSEFRNIRIAVAGNSHTPAEVLIMLASDPKNYVRIAVARNWNTPVEAFHILSNDTCVEVLIELADNSNTPLEILEKIAKRNKGRYWRAAQAAKNQLETRKAL